MPGRSVGVVCWAMLDIFTEPSEAVESNKKPRSFVVNLHQKLNRDEIKKFEHCFNSF